MSKRDLSRARACSAADKTDRRDGVMRRAIGAFCNGGLFQNTRYGMNTRGFEGFFKGKIG